MLKSIDRQSPKEWHSVITNFEIKQLFRWVEETSSFPSTFPSLSYGIFTPSFSRLELSTIFDVLLRFTKPGRESRGPDLLLRILKRRKEKELITGIHKLSSVSLKASKTTLVSYGQVIQLIVDLLSRKNERILSPNGERRLARQKKMCHSALSSPLMGGIDEIGNKNVLISPREGRRRRRKTFLLFTEKSKGAKVERMRGNKPFHPEMDILEMQRRQKKQQREKKMCALCEHLFPIKSMPSSISNGEVQRFRENLIIKKNKNSEMGLIQRLRFTMKDYGQSQEKEKNMKQKAEKAESNETIKDVNTSLMASAKPSRMGGMGYFQVQQVRKPLCVLCHDLVGRDYDIAENWKPNDPNPAESWLKLHGLQYI
jgi:hypothetical protein